MRRPSTPDPRLARKRNRAGRFRLRGRLAVLAFCLLGFAGAAVVGVEAGGVPGVALADSPPVTLATTGFPPGQWLSGSGGLEVSTTATIDSVEFEYSPAAQNDWQDIPSSYNTNYSAFDTTQLDGGTDGLYDLRAVVTDGDGDTLYSNTLKDLLIVNSSPVIQVKSPGSPVGGTIKLVADDPDQEDPDAIALGQGATAEFQYSPSGTEDWHDIPGANPSAANVPFDADSDEFETSFDTSTWTDGNYDFRVIVTDLTGQTDASIPARNVTVDNAPPTVSLQAASSLQGVATLCASASDSASAVASVQLQYSPISNGGNYVWQTFATRTVAPYCGVLNTWRLPNGQYELRAVATNAVGKFADSQPVGPVTLNNPTVSPPVTASVTGVVAPATSIQMLGSITESPSGANEDGDVWAYGFSDAAPAEVAGQRLPYTAEGHQLVLLRHTQDGGWQIADVLRNSDGSAFQLLPADETSATYVSGSMTATGDAWLLVTQTPKSGSGLSTIVALFHRQPGGQFLLDPELDPSSPDYNAQLAQFLTNTASGLGAQLSIGQQSPGGAPYGVLTNPGQPEASASVTPAGGGTSVQIKEALEYGLLEPDGTWTVDKATLPSTYVPHGGDQISLGVADVSGVNSGWAAFSVAPGGHTAEGVLLGQFSPSNGGEQWSFGSTGADELDLTSAAAQQASNPPSVTPNELRVFGNQIWLSGTIIAAGGNSPVVAELDASDGHAIQTWCSLPVSYIECSQPLNATNPAAVPNAVFQTASGEVALAVGNNFMDVFANDYWTSIATPGYLSGPNAATFTDQNDGWIAGANAVGQWATNAASPLASWPVADQAPLTAVAAPINGSDSTASQALAVGLHGSTLYYNETDGWLPASIPTTWEYAPPPPQASSLNLFGVAYNGSTSAVAVGQYGVILDWNGSSWSEDPQSFQLTEEQLNAVAFAPDGDGWAVGADGTILHYSAQSQSWSLEAPPAGEQETDITSVTVAGSQVYAVAGGNLIERASDGTWHDVPASDLPSDPAPAAGALRLVSGLPDGGIAAAGVDEFLTSQGAGQPFEYSAQPLEGIAVALSAFRQDDGNVGAFVSVAPPAEGSDDVGGDPPGDGDLVRFTDSGWQDLSQAQYAANASNASDNDGIIKADPVLAVASNQSGDHAWAVGGYAGTLSASGIGNYDPLGARSTTWYSASVWRYDSSGSATAPQLSSSTPNVPATPGTVSFAYFSSPECRWECAQVADAQPDVNLSAAAAEIAAYASQPGGPAFAMFGGNDRGPTTPQQGIDWDASQEYGSLSSLLAPLGSLPLYGALGPADHVTVAGLTDQVLPWAQTWITAPEPMGQAPAASGMNPVSSGNDVDDVSTYYAFDANQNGGTVRIIVLDNSLGSLDQSAPGQTSWLQQELSAAQSAGLPVVVFASQPLRLTSDGNSVATMLANAGVLAVFTTNPSNLNQEYMLPLNAPQGQAQIPEYEGASLGYQQSSNDAVDWYDVSVNATNDTLSVQAIPLIGSLALEPLQGLTVARSVTLQFAAIGRRPTGTIATYASTATGTGDDGYPGYDQYVQIPASGCSTCVTPSYSFTSSDPTIGTFVKPSGPGSPYPALSASGKTTPDSASGLFCAYNSGTTTVSITAGLETYSLPVTVEPGDYGPPCGTVARAGVSPVVYKVIKPSLGSLGAPVPPAGVAATATSAPVALPAALQHPPVGHASPAPTPPATTPPVVAQQPIAPVGFAPLPPPPVEPVPPGGAVAGGYAQSPATARREEKEREHAEQSAYVIRPAGTSADDWFFGVVGGVSVVLMLLASQSIRASSRPRPVWAGRPPAAGASHRPRR